MTELLSNIQTIVQNNQILSTIAGGSVIVWLVTNIKAAFHMTVNAVTSMISFNIFNYYEDERGVPGGRLFTKQKMFNEILSESTALWEKTVNMDMSTSDMFGILPPTSHDGKSLPYGFSIRWILGKLCIVNIGLSNNSQKILLTTHIRVFFANKDKFLNKLEKMVDERTCDYYSNDDDTRPFINVYNTSTGTWSTKSKRYIESIFTDNDGHMKLLDNIRDFIGNGDVYKKMNYPYKYSALMHGKPGCGKTSTILAIASELDRDIVYINPSKTSLDKILANMSSPSKQIYVFEDIDAVNTVISSDRDSEDSKDNRTSESNVIGMSLSDLLNITDGLLSSDGAICLFTTNHKEKLDEALLRPGRMNKIVEFTYLSGSTAKDMIYHNLGLSIDNLKDDIKPTELQEEILQIKLGNSDIEKLKDMFCNA